MKAEFKQVAAALNEASVHYVVVGGLAVIAHGYLRATTDVDLVINLDHDNLVNALGALETIGFQPRLPVSKEQFADPEQRNKWIVEKGMVVFPLWAPAGPDLIIDVFVKEPFDFDAEYERAEWMELEEGLQIPFVCREQLVEMKRVAGRPKDLEDIRNLEK